MLRQPGDSWHFRGPTAETWTALHPTCEENRVVPGSHFVSASWTLLASRSIVTLRCAHNSAVKCDLTIQTRKRAQQPAGFSGETGGVFLL
jgi:hypothetical protein